MVYTFLEPPTNEFSKDCLLPNIIAPAAKSSDLKGSKFGIGGHDHTRAMAIGGHCHGHELEVSTVEEAIFCVAFRVAVVVTEHSATVTHVGAFGEGALVGHGAVASVKAVAFFEENVSFCYHIDIIRFIPQDARAED